MATIQTWAPSTIYLPNSIVSPTSVSAPSLGVIGNAGFESGDSGWTKSTGFTIDNTAAFSGSWSAQYLSATDDGTLTNDTFSNVVPGQKITAKAMFKYATVRTPGKIRINWYTSGDVFISASDGEREIELPGQWQELTVTATAPATAAKAKIVAVAGANSAGVRFDNFSWNLISAGTPVANGLVFKAIQAESGLSGATEPTWPTVVGNTVVDNEVTWEAIEASTVTWEAGSILTSGSTEPTWPTTRKALVADNNIIWEAVPLHIEDEHCPHTKEVAIASTKIFAGDDDIVRFSATLNPRDWTSKSDAGFLPSGLHQLGEVGVSALGVYRGNLCVWSPSTFQLWQVDPDPQAMALLDSMEGIGSFHQRAVKTVADDLFFLAALGVRTVAIAAGANNLASGDAGVPIDTLVQAEVSDSVDPLSMYYPSAGQYWLAFPPSVPTVPGHVDDQPVVFTNQGVCATTDDLIQSDVVLSPIGLQMVGQNSHTLFTASVGTNGWAMDDSKVVSLTFAFCKEAGEEPTETKYGRIIHFTDQNVTKFTVRMDTSGFIRIEGWNVAATKILDVTISNGGVSWCDSIAHLFSFVVNMDDSGKREVYVDGQNITEDSAFITWTIYTDSVIQLRGTTTDSLEYGIGIDVNETSSWSGDNPNSTQEGFSSLGFICFDNRCTLVSTGMWDAEDLVLDPQGDFTGWFTIQPRMAWGPSFWKQQGEFAGFEKTLYPLVSGTNFYDNLYVQNQKDGTRINGGGEGSIVADTPTSTDPTPTPPPTSYVNLPREHWNNLSAGMSYNRVVLSNFTQKTYAQLTGKQIDATGVSTENNLNIGSGVAASFSNSAAGMVMIPVPSTTADKAAIVLTDNNGVIVDWNYYRSNPIIVNGTIAIPSDGATYWLVMTSDTGRIHMRKSNP